MKNRITFHPTVREYPTFATLVAGTIFQRADEPQILAPTFMVLCRTAVPIGAGCYAVRLDDGDVIKFGMTEKVIPITDAVTICRQEN